MSPTGWPRATLVALLIASMAGCLPLPTTQAPRPTVAAEGTIRAGNPAAGTRPADGLGEPTLAGGGIVSNNGGGIVSNNSASLTGVVHAPAGLISNNGGTIISNGGAGYRLLAIEQQPVRRARVEVLDARGRAIEGPDGQPLTATTDDQGRYRVQADLPARHVLLRVTLPDAKGALQAIAPRGGTQRQADLDLVSTLVTTYVLDRYVAGQPDPVATLEKLPPDVEAATRARAAAAKGLAVPEKLTAEEVVETVEGMRRADSAFDAQLEDVKELLLGAGQSDLGSGRPATEVPLRSLNAVALGPDGTLYLCDWNSRRIWRLGTDGLIATAAGTGVPSAASLQGQAGPQAGLFELQGIAPDATGRLLILERPFAEDDAFQGTATHARLSRLETDGTLTELWADLKPALAAVPAAEGAIRVITDGDAEAGLAAEVWLLRADGTRVREHTFSSADSAAIAMAVGYGQDAQGRIYLRKSDGLKCYTPGSKTLSVVPDRGDDGPDQSFFHAAVDANGHYFFKRQAERTLTWRQPDGAVTALAGAPLKGLLMAATAAADGAIYYADFAGSIIRVFKLPRGAAQPTQVAGLASTAGDGKSALALALQKPGGITFTTGGDAFVADSAAHTITRLAGQQATAFAGSGSATTSGDNGPALQAGIGRPGKLQRDGAGNLYVLEGAPFARAIRKVTPAGTITTVGSSGTAKVFTDVAVAPDGTMYVGMVQQSGHRSVVRVSQDGPTTLYEKNVAESAYGSMALYVDLGADGALTILDQQRLMRWTGARGLVPLADDARFGLEVPMFGSTIATDREGRVYFTHLETDTLTQYDPAIAAFKVIAGPGGLMASGDTVDDSLEDPTFPALDDQGNLYVSDTGHGQVKVFKAGSY